MGSKINIISCKLGEIEFFWELLLVFPATIVQFVTVPHRTDHCAYSIMHLEWRPIRVWYIFSQSAILASNYGIMGYVQKALLSILISLQKTHFFAEEMLHLGLYRRGTHLSVPGGCTCMSGGQDRLFISLLAFFRFPVAT